MKHMQGFQTISRTPFRSLVVVLCALLVAGFALAAVLIVRGAGESLDLAETRFGADVIVVPEGAERQAKGALLMASPMNAWIPADTVQQVRDVPGVQAASPQLYLATEKQPVDVEVLGMDPEAARLYFPTESIFLVAYDPATDFAVGPWLPEGTTGGLSRGESFGGAEVSVPEGADRVTFHGLELAIKARLRPSGSSLDDSLLVSFETAQEILASGAADAAHGFAVPRDSVSSILVRVSPEADPGSVAAAIQGSVPGSVSLTSPDLFASFREQMEAQRAGMLGALGVLLALSVGIITLVFSLVVNQQRRQVGVVRALGATRARVTRSLLGSAAILAAVGGVAGVVIGGVVVYLLRGALSDVFGFPFTFPSPISLAVMIVAGLAAAVAAVVIAAFIPAYRISRQDPAVSMRE